jgi:NAD(P)-dependent dehydrogenase (short-subunit alcohol dehydrogenase family)
MRFSGKTAVITGGAVGFGRAFARALIGEGASAAILDIDASMARRTVAELTEQGARVIAVPCDVADEQQVDTLVAGSQISPSAVSLPALVESSPPMA